VSSIKEIAEERKEFRAKCRIVADSLLETILTELDKAPRDQQNHIVSMLMTELQIAARKANPQAVETKSK
jgi:hypothetical protein